MTSITERSRAGTVSVRTIASPIGQILSLRPTTPPAQTQPAQHAAPAAVPPSVATAPPVQAPAPGRWMWPTSVVQSPRAVAGGGILLQGILGQPVRAADGGRVVYVGSGIRGYGNLIIVKHDESFLSAYAHTQDVAVHEGQEVLGAK